MTGADSELDGVGTAHGTLLGSLADVEAVELGRTAIDGLLERNDLAVDDVDAYWINEAFAAQAVYVMERVGIPREKMNPQGGAVAFGHPIGASGGMLAASLAYQIRDDPGVERGFVGMSIGGGGAIMGLLERY